MALKWFGPQIVKDMEKASIKGVNATMAISAVHAKRNHKGWRNRTGKAEGSIRIIAGAKKSGSAVQGTWGSLGVAYMRWLEFKHGAALRASAAINYPLLTGNIRKFFNR